MANDDVFEVGNVLFEIGYMDKYVVVGFDMTGMMLGQVIFGQVYPACRWVGKTGYGGFVKVNRWDFSRSLEVGDA